MSARGAVEGGEMRVRFWERSCISAGWRVESLGCGKSRKIKFMLPMIKNRALRIRRQYTWGCGFGRNDSVGSVCERGRSAGAWSWVRRACSGVRTEPQSSGTRRAGPVQGARGGSRGFSGPRPVGAGPRTAGSSGRPGWRGVGPGPALQLLAAP